MNSLQRTAMDDVTLLVAFSCLALAALVYLMWRSATGASWQELTHREKKRWRLEEEKLKEKGCHSLLPLGNFRGCRRIVCHLNWRRLVLPATAPFRNTHTAPACLGHCRRFPASALGRDKAACEGVNLHPTFPKKSTDRKPSKSSAAMRNIAIFQAGIAIRDER